MRPPDWRRRARAACRGGKDAMGEDRVIARGRARAKDSREHAPAGEVWIERASVLIVDDDGMLRALLAELLGSAGYRVLLADNGKAALSVAERARPSLVLTDCSMPQLDGAELVRRLRAHPRTRHIPVVAMSAARPHAEALV